MQETKLTWSTPDGKTIYGVRSGNPANPAVVMVHGLTGHMYEHQLKHGAEILSADFCVYRFNLYDGEEGARSLEQCTLQTHADDFQTVINALKPHHKTIFAVGHSFGGTTIMLANSPHLTAVCLWDPSYDLSWADESFYTPFPSLPDVYAVNWGTIQIIGKSMRDHALLLDAEACQKLATTAPFPVQVILAGEGDYVKRDHSYDSHGHPRNRRHVIEGTSHCFYENDTGTQAAILTAQWFKEWL